MWVAKFKNWHKTCLIRPLCQAYNVTDLVYMINYWEESENFFYTELHILQGEEKNTKQFIKDMQKDPATIKVEIKGNHIITLNKIKLVEEYKNLFNPEIIYVKPVTQRIDGFEDWEIASWNREALMKVMDVPIFNMKLISIEKLDLFDLFVPQLLPKLSTKQKQAIELAIKEKYYTYPRKIQLNELAKISKVSTQTFQENLAKAENKILPFLTERINK